jgi:hypothetical protein
MSLAAFRRRWWVVLLCVAAVAGVAYLVGELRARTSSAEAVVMLNPGVIAPVPVAADQSGKLAADYAQVIPQDAALQQAVGARLGTPVRGRVTTASAPSSSLVRIGFRASTEAGAVAGARAVAEALTGQSPASPTIVPGTIGIVRLPTSARRARVVRNGYVATAVVVTSAGGGPAGPGYGDQATRLAPSFAASIPDDAGILAFVARRLGVSVHEVDDHTTVKNDKDTAVLRLRYKADGDVAAERGARALAAAVTGSAPASPTIKAREFTLVRVAAAESPSSNAAVTLPIGALLGLCLGIVLLLALERANPRVDDPAFLEDELRCPVYDVDEVTPSLAGALLERWRALGGGGHPTVALIPASAAAEAATAGLAQRLTAYGAAAADEDDELRSGPLRLVIGREPSADAAAAAVAARSDVVVLVALQGQPLSALREACHALDTFEAPVQWGLLVRRSARRRLEADATVVSERSEQPTGASAV